jgi:hypothetical protein
VISLRGSEDHPRKHRKRRIRVEASLAVTDSSRRGGIVSARRSPRGREKTFGNPALSYTASSPHAGQNRTDAGSTGNPPYSKAEARVVLVHSAQE